jgi:uncharacterized membrane protein YphA (DoxX/SURF4 family)
MLEALAKDTLAPLVLRLVLAAIFLFHGYTKISGPDNSGGASWANTMWKEKEEPLPAPLMARLSEEAQTSIRKTWVAPKEEMPGVLQTHIIQIAVAWGELLGGVALLVGMLTRLAALGLIVIQAGAMYTVTLGQGFSDAAGGGYEYNLALVAMCVAVVLLGPGALSLDRMVRAKPKPPA